jgi:G3E family GTPase
MPDTLGSPRPPVPALIVSGYLGSGKTTLVSHLLKDAQARGLKLAIISNEFGDTGIDRALLDAGNEGFVELDGGCVCCRLSDALGETLEVILEQVEPDRLVLETSGVALPGEVLIQFWRPPVDELISEEFVAIMVDAYHLTHTKQLEPTFVEQLEAADLVILNKRDLINDDEAQRCASRLTELTAGQPVVESVQAIVDPGLLFPSDHTEQRQERRDPNASMHPHAHERFNTEELLFEGLVDLDEVIATLQSRAAVRAKGFVRTAAGVRTVQGVGTRIDVDEPLQPIPEHLVGRVVLIDRVPDAPHEPHS